MGNIKAGKDGIGRLNNTDEKLMLYGPNSILGRSCVCHANVDDLGDGGHELSPTTGNAGGRVACGVIGISGPFWIDQDVRNTLSCDWKPTFLDK